MLTTAGNILIKDRKALKMNKYRRNLVLMIEEKKRDE